MSDLAVVLGLILLIAGIGVFVLGTGWSLAHEWVARTLALILNHSWETMAAGAILVLLGLLLVLRPRESQDISFVVPSRLGEVRITQAALRSIVARAALGVEGVRQVDSSLAGRPEGLEITVSGELFPEVVLTQISEAVQTAVKRDVETYTGIRVTEVKVLVRSVEGLHQARVK